MSATPHATCTLPDGQKVTVRVTARRRNQAGQWWYECELDLYERIDQQPDQPSIASPHPVTFWAPHPIIQPLPDQDYSQLNASVEFNATSTWGVETVTSFSGHRLRIHAGGCWMAETDNTFEIDAAAATALLQTGEADECACVKGSKAR